MKKFLIVLLLLVAVGIYFLPGKKPANNEGKISPEAAISNAFATVSPQAKAAIDSSFKKISNAAPGKILASAAQIMLAKAGPTNAPEITNMDPLAVMENTRTAIRNYGQRLGGNPIGSNEEITRALMGENPKQLNFISADAGLRVNGKGELIDAWGTPFFFHQLSGEQMEIHSAGPDKLMWTLDDLVVH